MVSDVKVPTVANNQVTDLTADVVSATDYYPFGMQMPGRVYNGPDYRYGFNGMEKDDEVKGEGNSYTTQFRQYDPRLGRWLSLDRMRFLAAQESPYTFSGNNPIYGSDPNGDLCGPCILISVISELAVQVGGKMALEGMDFFEAVEQINYYSVGWAAVSAGINPLKPAEPLLKLMKNPAVRKLVRESLENIIEIAADYLADVMDNDPDADLIASITGQLAGLGFSKMIKRADFGLDTKLSKSKEAEISIAKRTKGRLESISTGKTNDIKKLSKNVDDLMRLNRERDLLRLTTVFPKVGAEAYKVGVNGVLRTKSQSEGEKHKRRQDNKPTITF